MDPVEPARPGLEVGGGGGVEDCCEGVPNLELWGAAVKWGTEFKFNSSAGCCRACRAMCGGGDGPCLCDSWVFCGDRESCGPHFGELGILFLVKFLIFFVLGVDDLMLLGC